MRLTLILAVVSFIGIWLGISAFFVFLFFYGCKDASIWAFLAGLLSAMNFHLHYLYLREKLHSWHTVESLLHMKHLGFFMFVSSSASMAWYIFQFIYNHSGIYPISESRQIMAIWAFMTAKWSGSLIYSCHKYLKYLTSHSYLPLSAN